MKHKQGKLEKEEACTHFVWVWVTFKLETWPKSPENMLIYWKISQSRLVREIYKEEEEKMERVSSENKTTQQIFQEYDLLPDFLSFHTSLWNLRF